MDFFYNIWANAPKDSSAHNSMNDFLSRLIIGEITKEDLAPLCLESNISKDIPVKSIIGSTGGHSYGLGCGLEVDGWIDDAINFWLTQFL